MLTSDGTTMILDPTLKRLIKKAYANGFDQIHLFTPDKMRDYLTHPKIKGVKAYHQDFITDENITIRCYSPTNIDASTPLPAVIYLSANAYVIDRFTACGDFCNLLADVLQMRIINIAHRLAPEFKFPICLYDCLHAIQWIAKHRDVLNITHQISIWGESSGANIAASCTHLLRDEASSILCYQTLFYPMVDLITPFESKSKYAKGYMLDRTFLAWLEIQGMEADQDYSSPLISPLLSNSFSSLPPATIITAHFDPFHDEGHAYAEKLKQADVPVMVYEFPDMIHGFMRFYPKLHACHAALELACHQLKAALQSTIESSVLASSTQSLAEPL